MAHNDNQASMDAFFAGLEGTQNVRLNADDKLKIIDVNDGKFYEIWFNDGVLMHSEVGEE